MAYLAVSRGSTNETKAAKHATAGVSWLQLNMPNSDALCPVEFVGLEKIPGFDDPKRCDELRAAILQLLDRLRRDHRLDLSRLEAVTIANDYDRALATFDTGFADHHVLSKSSGGSEGVGMTPVVLRDGKIRCHLFLRADVAIQIMRSNSEYFRYGLYTLIHEACHAHDIACRARTLEQHMIQPVCDATEPFFLKISLTHVGTNTPRQG